MPRQNRPVEFTSFPAKLEPVMGNLAGKLRASPECAQKTFHALDIIMLEISFKLSKAGISSLGVCEQVLEIEAILQQFLRQELPVGVIQGQNVAWGSIRKEIQDLMDRPHWKKVLAAAHSGLQPRAGGQAPGRRAVCIRCGLRAAGTGA